MREAFALSDSTMETRSWLEEAVASATRHTMLYLRLIINLSKTRGEPAAGPKPILAVNIKHFHPLDLEHHPRKDCTSSLHARLSHLKEARPN